MDEQERERFDSARAERRASASPEEIAAAQRRQVEWARSDDLDQQIVELKLRLQQMSPIGQGDEYHALFAYLVALESRRQARRPLSESLPRFGSVMRPASSMNAWRGFRPWVWGVFWLVGVFCVVVLALWVMGR